MKNRLVAVFAAMLLPWVGAAENEAEVTLTCFSLVFEPSTIETLGLWSVVDIGTRLTDDGQALNQELSFAVGDRGGFFGAVFVLTDEEFDPVVGFVSLDVPTGLDADEDGMNDFFQIDQAVSQVTAGVYLTDDDREGSITATWSRAAGSASGTCTLQWTRHEFDLLDAFPHTFHLLQYRGFMGYARSGDMISSDLTLTAIDNPGLTFAGTMDFEQVERDGLPTLVVNAGSLTNESGQIMTAEEGAIRGTGDTEKYIGSTRFVDGNFATTAPDFQLWSLAIVDSSDTDGDGVPDLTDAPEPVQAPKLQIEVEADGLLLTIIGTPGSVYELERNDTLAEHLWTPELSVTAATDSHAINVNPEGGPAGFWRLKAAEEQGATNP